MGFESIYEYTIKPMGGNNGIKNNINVAIIFDIVMVRSLIL